MVFAPNNALLTHCKRVAHWSLQRFSRLNHTQVLQIVLRDNLHEISKVGQALTELKGAFAGTVAGGSEALDFLDPPLNIDVESVLLRTNYINLQKQDKWSGSLKQKWRRRIIKNICATSMFTCSWTHDLKSTGKHLQYLCFLKSDTCIFSPDKGKHLACAVSIHAVWEFPENSLSWTLLVYWKSPWTHL